MTAQVAADLRRIAKTLEDDSDPEGAWAAENGPAFWIVWHLRSKGTPWPEVVAGLRTAAEWAEASA